MAESLMTFELPSSLALQRIAVISDARMYSEVEGEYQAFPVEVIRHGIRGTQNVFKGGAGSGEVSTTVEDDDVRNLQVVDSAKLHPKAQRLVVEYSFAFMDLAFSIASISPDKGTDEQYLAQFKGSIDHFIERSKSSAGLVEVCNRFARNLLNGRWLWRNRLIASNIVIDVSSEESPVAQANAFDIPLKEFSNYSPDELALGTVLAEQLRGNNLKPLKVRATLDLLGTGAIEVYPSQNYIDDEKARKELSRSLYVYNKPRTQDKAGPILMGFAAIRDQKIGNALRTIDTWYDEEPCEPIAVEPLGANLKALKFFRQRSKSAFSMMQRLNEIDPASPEGMFMIASFLRGGVFTRS